VCVKSCNESIEESRGILLFALTCLCVFRDCFMKTISETPFHRGTKVRTDKQQCHQREITISRKMGPLHLSREPCTSIRLRYSTSSLLERHGSELYGVYERTQDGKLNGSDVKARKSTRSHSPSNEAKTMTKQVPR